MASGHVNRANRPNTWLLRPILRREDSPCQPGAVHTWKAPPFHGAHPAQTSVLWAFPIAEPRLLDPHRSRSMTKT